MSWSSADLAKLLNQPGILSFRDYGSSGAWTEFLGCNGARYDLDKDESEVAFDDVGTVEENIANERGIIKIQAGKVFDMDNLVDLTGGLFTRTPIAAAPVLNAQQVIASGYWNYDEPIIFDNQNGDGTCPTIDSVTGSVDGALVLNTDYFIVDIDGQGWGIVLRDSTTLTTEAQSITIQTDYTPAASVDYTWGGVAVKTPIELKFETETHAGKAVTIYFYKVFPSGKFGHGFGSENKAEPVLTDLEFTAKKDTTRGEGDQVMKINIAA